ncbi:MAG TPA: ABC transporter permease, partial [Burkholderiaceae bacterium]|nr:ABC transporter permease [Burkholderiaceae bacterium]
MAKTLRPISLIALIALALLPLAWVTGRAVLAGLDVDAWQHMLLDPALTSSLLLSLWTGLASTCLAYALSMWLISRLFMRADFQHQLQRLSVALGPMLAMPHAALAIGLVFLLSPSGWLLRLFSPWLTGFDFPPAWQTTQDPLGLGLIAALVAKETPFLLWNALTQLARADV